MSACKRATRLWASMCCALAFAAALLAPGAARAVNECGATPTAGVFTCANQAYPSGIAYWFNQERAVTLDVVGGAATTITGGSYGALAVRTESHATEVRNIGVTVGSEGAVVIRPGRGSEASRGIRIRQGNGNGSTTTLDVRNGVTIGTATARVSRGIDVAVDGGTAGDASITNAATIYSDWTLAISGVNTGSGGVAVANSGNIDSTGKGIVAHVGAYRDRDDPYVSPTNTGVAKVSVTAGSIMSVNTAIEAINYEAGSVEVSVSKGVTLTINPADLSVSHGIHAELADVDNTSGTITVANAGRIVGRTTRGADDISNISNESGIYVKYGGVLSGDATITNSGDIVSAANGSFRNGILLDLGNWSQDDSGGRVTITNSGDIMVTGTGIGLGNYYPTEMFIANSGSIGAADARVAGGIEGTAGRDFTITNSGDIAAESYGINSYAGDKASIIVTGGSISVNGQLSSSDDFYYGYTSAIISSGDLVSIEVSQGVTLVSKHNAGIHAVMNDFNNTQGQVKIIQSGAISGRTGIYARALNRYSATGETPAALAQPAVDIAWTGRFAHGAGTAENDADRVRLPPASEYATMGGHIVSALPILRIVEASKAIRYGQAAGIEVQLVPGTGTTEGNLGTINIMSEVAKGDASGAVENDNDQLRVLEGPSGEAVVTRLRAVLTNAYFEIPGVAGIDRNGDGAYDDGEIRRYLGTPSPAHRRLLTELLAASLSEKEKAVLVALVTGGDVDAALDDAEAGFSDDYKTAVRDALKRFNPGNIRIAVNGGSIESRGDGVRAYFTTPHNGNGRIDVTVAEGATVAGGVAGVYVANAGMGEIAGDSPRGKALYLDEDATLTLRQQFVTVHGTVTGGTDAAVHLSGGGALIVGEKGKVYAGSSGRAVLVNDPGRSEIVIHGEVRGGEGARAAVDVTGGGTVTVGLTGRVTANGAARAIHAGKATPDDTRTTAVILLVPADTGVDGRVSKEAADAAAARVQGGIGGDGVADDRVIFAAADDEGLTGHTKPVALAGDGRPNTESLPPAPQGGGEGLGAGPGAGEEEEEDDMSGGGRRQAPASFDCDMAAMSDDRCRLYSALPSALLAMNGLPTWEERMAAARSEAGGWARIETARGEWKADSSTRAGVAYDRARSGVRVGVDRPVGETGRFGLSAHGLRGSANMTQNGGKIELSGMGVSLYGSAVVGPGVYVDASAQGTRYDAKLTSKTGMVLKDSVSGTGYALAAEAGRPMALTESVTLTPRAGFVWSRVSLGDFADSRAATLVSMEDAESLTGRAGVSVALAPGGPDGFRVVGSAEATHEFSGETGIRVAGTPLKASPETTGARFALGAAHSWGEGRFALQASANYATGGNRGDGFGGGLSLSARF